MLHIPIVHAHDVSKQIPREKNFPSGWKCYKTIGSYVSCAFIEIWSTWEVWRALKKLELLSATPRATLTHLSCSPNFSRALYLDERTLTYEPIVNLRYTRDIKPERRWCSFEKRNSIAFGLFRHKDKFHAFASLNSKIQTPFPPPPPPHRVFKSLRLVPSNSRPRGQNYVQMPYPSSF